MRNFLYTTLVLLLFGIAGIAQSNTPTVNNAGGGFYNNPNSYFRYFEWSIGELTLISTAVPADSSFIVYQGVLQPCTDKLIAPIASEFLPGDYKIMPNPNTGKFEINFFVRENGQMDLELVDILGKVYEKRSFHYNGCCRIEQYDISNLPAGVYFISATLTPDPFGRLDLRQVKRHGGLKIIKVR
jgi:Secretion system C-terminal sorting domain